MNSLETFIQSSKLDETWAMNALQDRGIISDNCVTAHDVAPADCERAIKFLRAEHQRPML